MSSDYIIASIKLCQVGNNEYIFVCSFSGRRMRSFEIIEGDRKPKKNTRKEKRKEKPGVNRVNFPQNVYTYMQGL